MPLTDADVRALAMLARLELSPEEVATIGPQLENILGFVEQLSELATEDIEPMTTALDVVNRWAIDSPSDSLSREKALQNSPLQDGEFFQVPPVLGVAG